MARRIGRGGKPAGVVGGGGPSRYGRGGPPPVAQNPTRTFEKGSDFVTGDYLGSVRRGDLGLNTASNDLWVCVNGTTAVWEKVGTQT